jgi:AraC family ethanolamine operon transcriptional activator
MLVRNLRLATVSRTALSASAAERASGFAEVGLAATGDRIRPRPPSAQLLSSGGTAPEASYSVRQVGPDVYRNPAGKGQDVAERDANANYPAVTVVEINDPTTVGQGIELIDQDAVHLATTPFRARQVVVRLAGGTVIYHSTNQRVRVRTKVQRGLLAYVTFGPRATGTMNGLPIRHQLMVAVEPETEVLTVSDAGYHSVAFLLSAEDIRAHLGFRRRDDDFRMPHGVETLRAAPAGVRLLYDWGKRLVDTAVRRPALFNDRKDERAAAQVEMVETLLATLGSARDFEPARAERMHQSQTLVVKAAEDYALTHLGEHIYLTELCQAAAASERTLEYAFKAVMRMTPIAYLIRLRLHRARRTLLVATHGSATVSAVALDSGFWHFGEFSRAYRDLFGELPSDTLRQRPARIER